MSATTSDTTQRPRQSRSTFKKLAFTTVLWAIVFLVLEVGVRLYVAVASMNAPETAKTTNDAAAFVPHPFCVYVPNPEHRNHSEQGYRAARNYEPDFDGLRIVTMGGSSTYGSQVKFEHSYPKLLEDKLAEANPNQRVEVVNAGVSGYATPGIINLLSLRVVELRPRICIIYTGFNDVWNRIRFNEFNLDSSHAMRSWQKPTQWPWHRSELINQLAKVAGYPYWSKPHIHRVCWNSPSGTADQNWDPKKLQTFERNLKTIIGICRTHDIQPILCTQATDFEGHPIADAEIWAKAMESATDAIKSIGQQESVTVIDIRTPMTNKAEYFADCLHMNEAGNRFRADLIAKHLSESPPSPAETSVEHTPTPIAR